MGGREGNRAIKIVVTLFISCIIVLLVLSTFIRIWRVGGDSMEPTLYSGDIIVTIDGQVKEGEIIVYKHQGNYIMHRVDHIDNVNGVVQIYTKGDNRDTIDEVVVTEDMVVGTAILILDDT